MAVAVGGIYCFGILNAVVPNSEDLGSTQNWYLILNMGRPYHPFNMLGDLAGCVSVMIGGMSFLSRRLEFTLLYTMILGASLWLSVSGRAQGKRWAVLPLWAFFMVFVHTVQGDQTFGRVYESIDWIWQIPYHYHTLALIFALLCMMILQSCLNADTLKKKKVIGLAGVLIGIYALRFTDLIYGIVFLGPFLIVLLLKGVYHDKVRKYLLPICGIGVGMMLFTRMLPVAFLERLWGREAVGLYGGVYGATNWLNLDDILTSFMNYIKTVMLLFNIEVSDRPVLSFYSLLFIIRMAFVCIGYVIVMKIVVRSVKGRAEQSGYTMMDEILAWAFFVLSCSFIFTGNGMDSNAIRYYGALVPLLTILLCRNVDREMRELLPVLKSVAHKKIYFAGIMGALCICQAEPVWQYQAYDSHQEDCEAVVEWLSMWGAEAEGYALAPFWLCSRLSAVADGDILFYSREDQIREIYGEDAVIKYVVVGFEEEILTRNYDMAWGYSSYDEWSENYRESIRRAVDLDYVYVCEFAE